MSLQPGMTSAGIDDDSGVAQATTSSLCTYLHYEIRFNEKRKILKSTRAEKVSSWIKSTAVRFRAMFSQNDVFLF